MNQPSQQQATPSTDASTNGTGVTVVPSLEERSAAAFGIDTPSEPAADTANGKPPAPPGTPAASTADSEGVTDPNAAARAARRAQFEKLAAEERARVDAQARRREHDDIRRRLEEAERKAAEAEGRIDPTKLSPDELLDLFDKGQVDANKLGQRIRERMTNPEVLAAQAAAKAVDPKVTALEQKIAAQEKVIEDFIAQQAKQQQAAEEAHYLSQFQAFTRENAATAPHSAKFLEVYGPEEFAAVTLGAAAKVPQGSGAQAILDELEDKLALLAKVYAPTTGAPQQRQAPPSPNPAAAKAPTTVSNTLAQTRASVVDEDADWASLPFEERSARLFR